MTEKHTGINKNPKLSSVLTTIITSLGGVSLTMIIPYLIVYFYGTSNMKSIDNPMKSIENPMNTVLIMDNIDKKDNKPEDIDSDNETQYSETKDDQFPLNKEAKIELLMIEPEGQEQPKTKQSIDDMDQDAFHVYIQQFIEYMTQLAQKEFTTMDDRQIYQENPHNIWQVSEEIFLQCDEEFRQCEQDYQVSTLPQAERNRIFFDTQAAIFQKRTQAFAMRTSIFNKQATLTPYQIELGQYDENVRQCAYNVRKWEVEAKILVVDIKICDVEFKMWLKDLETSDHSTKSYEIYSQKYNQTLAKRKTAVYQYFKTLPTMIKNRENALLAFKDAINKCQQFVDRHS